MFRSAVTPPRMPTLFLLTGLSVLSLNMFLPSLSNMAADFEVDYALVSLSIAGYLAATAVLQIIMGPLSDRFGRRPLLLFGLSLFTLASLVCVFATDIWVFLAFRVLQGAIICGSALSLAAIRDVAPPQKAASLIGYLSMAMAAAPMLGPMLGGALDALFGWRASFVAYAVFGLSMLAFCWVEFGETNTKPSATFAKQLRLYPELLRAPGFWGYALCTAFSTGAFYAFLAGAPLVATTIYGMSPAMLGVCLGSITAGFMLGSFLSGRLAQRHALTTMMIAGRVVACFGLLLGLVLLAVGALNAILFFGATIFVGIGNGLTTPSSSAGALSVRPQLAGSASGLAGALTVATGAAVTPFTGTLVTEANGAYALLIIMLLSSSLALFAALLVRRIERLERRARPETSV
ncbi:MAG: multidrug effflux MFS transporter [Kiloniellales bacterium]|nr:multidrug effflux MFS transporter [Kiloniellales bacterium]